MMVRKNFVVGNAMFSVSSCEIELPRCRYNGPEGFANSFRNFIFHICGQNCISLVGFISLPYLPFTLTLPSCLQQSSPRAHFPPKSQILNLEPRGFVWSTLMTQSMPGSYAAKSGLYGREKLHFSYGSKEGAQVILR